MEKRGLESADDKRLIWGHCPSSILRATVIFALVLNFLGGAAPLAVFAVSYPPAPLYHRQEKLETPMRRGDTVYLFHSGTDDVKRSIHVSDELVVYRINPSCKASPVGKIKVLAYIGETYLEGVVLEGEIMPSDIARKGNVSCLIILTGMCQ